MSDRLISKSQQEMIDAQQFGEFLGDGGLGKATVKAFKDVGNKAVDYAGIQADKAAEKIASWTQDMQAAEGPDVSPLRYPHDLLEEDPCQRDLSAGSTREIMRFNIKSRHDLENRQTIYLYTPPGIAAADSATYSTSEFGFLGALQQNASTLAPLVKGDAAGASSSVTDIVLQNKEAVAGGLAIAAKDKLGWGVLDKGLITAGRAKNANTNLKFDGIGMRSFTFSFKLVSESEDEAEEIRKIENTFRKYVYPENESELGMVLKYPPYWSIQFMSHRNGQVSENTFLPFIDLCYLRSVGVTYNSSTNAYHKGGQPIELDLSLSFDEAQQNTRGGLYTPGSVDYTYERSGLESTSAEAFTESMKGRPE